MPVSVIQKIKESLDQTPQTGGQMKSLLADESRCRGLTFEVDGLMADMTRQTITAEQHQLLFDFCHARRVMENHAAMMAGEVVNYTQNRAALHCRLRDFQSDLAKKSRRAMRDMANRLGDDKITDLVSIGIGGSDLGPKMVVHALKPLHQNMKIHFVSNLDPAHLADTLAELNPRKSAFAIVSKSFTTADTLANFAIVKDWLACADIDALSRSVAITENLSAARQAGFTDDHILPLDPSVGGRYSLWSTVGFGVMLAIGEDAFTTMLEGGNAIDRHASTAALADNIPLNLALMRVWNTSFLKRPAAAVIPYDHRLRHLTAWVQQLEMESNGKTLLADGQTVSTLATAPIIFGAEGSNAQHSFFQLLHQGSVIVPVDFLAPQCQTTRGISPDLATDNHRKLIIQMLAQADSLALGDEDNNAFPGGRPSTIIVWDKLSPFDLGRLLALYEHATVMAGAMWGVNSFDQPGVERPKAIAAHYHAILDGNPRPTQITNSTKSILSRLKDKKSY